MEGEVANTSMDSQTLSQCRRVGRARRKVDSLVFFSKARLRAVLFLYDVRPLVLH